MKTQTAPLYIFTKFNEGDIEGANAIAAVLAVISFAIFSLILFTRRGWKIGREQGVGSGEREYLSLYSHSLLPVPPRIKARYEMAREMVAPSTTLKPGLNPNHRRGSPWSFAA